MTAAEQNEFLAREYKEAIRYMDNARETLAKSKKDGDDYADSKYVRVACGTAYCGILIALDAWLVMKGVLDPSHNRRQNKKPNKKPQQKPRKSIDFYMDRIAKLDGKLLKYLQSAYGILHLDGYYDGNGCGRAVTTGFGLADDIIEKIKPHQAA